MKKINIKDVNMGVTMNGFKQALVKRVFSPSRKYSRFLSASQWWTKSDLQACQLEQLQSVVKTAYRHVPYYRGTMQVFNVQPEDIRSLDDISLMPFVEKDMLRCRGQDFLSTKAALPALYKCHTSGTTGTPLTLYRDLRNIGFEYAMLSRQRRWAGLMPGERYATLKGELIAGRNVSRGQYWSFNMAENKLVMSSYHLSEATFERYVDALSKYRVEAIDGYPSSVYALAKFMIERDIRLPLKAVLTSSETLVAEQKIIIEAAFNCRVYDYYGMAERIAAVHTCEHGSYHVVPEYSLVEFLRTSSLADPYYEIVGTAFTNHAMPLIRYRIGDVAEVSHEKCSCGREYPVINGIVGRTDDYVVTPSGKMVGRLDHIFKGAHNLIQAQIYQPERNRIVLRIVPDHSFTKHDGDAILEKLNHRLGEEMNFEIENVSFIPRTSRGKIQSVISDVKIFTHEGR
jgi:phenylacetate-CoA ligase